MKSWNELDSDEKENVDYLVQSWGVTREDILSMGYFCIHPCEHYDKMISLLQDKKNCSDIKYFVDSEDGVLDCENGSRYIGVYTPRDAVAVMVLLEIVSGERDIRDLYR